jgi:hypothetical protein
LRLSGLCSSNFYYNFNIEAVKAAPEGSHASASSKLEVETRDRATPEQALKVASEKEIENESTSELTERCSLEERNEQMVSSSCVSFLPFFIVCADLTPKNSMADQIWTPIADSSSSPPASQTPTPDPPPQAPCHAQPPHLAAGLSPQGSSGRPSCSGESFIRYSDLDS